ncbi:MAG: TRAP transporter substrate-binding protein DctP [Deferrisomatales bacterium]|nr:TRAP transporter substrate-binding protein DctP [Deferrisomatales bacterium]
MRPPRNTLILAVALGLVAPFVVEPAAAARTSLKIATLAPEGTSWMQELRRGAEEVAAATEGRVEIRFYPGGVMGNDRTVLRKIRAGQLQGGAFTAGSLTEIYPDTDIYGLPFLFRSYDEVDYVRERVDPLLEEGLARGGMVALGISEGGFAYLFSGSPVRRVDDLKGKKVWIPEGDLVSRTALEVAGITPVPLPLADVYTALQTRLVDTVATSTSGAIAFQWHTRVKHFTDVPLSYLVGVVALDRRAFERLRPGDQEAVHEHMGAALARLDVLNREGNRRAREALLQQGIEAVKPESPAELERWRGIADEAMRRLGGRQAFSPETLEMVQEHLRQFRQHQGGGGGG